MKQTLLILLLFISFSCRKKAGRLLPSEAIEPDIELTRGLPPDPAKINALLCAVHLRSFNGNLPETKHLRVNAVFNDEKTNLFSFLNFYDPNLISVQGKITVNGLSYNGRYVPQHLGSQSCFYGEEYVVNSHQNFSHWKHGGNKTYPSLDLKSDSLIPGAQPAPFLTAIYRSNQLLIDPKTYCTDFDSCFVQFKYGYHSKTIQKACGANEQIKLLPEDFDIFPVGEEFGKVIITLVRYYHLRQGGKATVCVYAGSLSFNVIYRN